MHCAAVLTQSPNLQGFYRVPDPHGLRSVWPLQASIHICLLLTMGITESRLNAKKATIYLKQWTHPQAGAAILPPVVSGTTSPLWTQGPQPIQTYTLQDGACGDQHTCTYINIYIYIFCLFVFICEHLLWRKTLSRHTHTHIHTHPCNVSTVRQGGYPEA